MVALIGITIVFVLIIIIGGIAFLISRKKKKEAEEAISDLKRMMDEKVSPTPGVTPSGPTQKDFQDFMERLKKAQGGNTGAWWRRKK